MWLSLPPECKAALLEPVGQFFLSTDMRKTAPIHQTDPDQPSWANYIYTHYLTVVNFVTFYCDCLAGKRHHVTLAVSSPWCLSVIKFFFVLSALTVLFVTLVAERFRYFVHSGQRCSPFSLHAVHRRTLICREILVFRDLLLPWHWEQLMYRKPPQLWHTSPFRLWKGKRKIKLRIEMQK